MSTLHPANWLPEQEVAAWRTAEECSATLLQKHLSSLPAPLWHPPYLYSKTIPFLRLDLRPWPSPLHQATHEGMKHNLNHTVAGLPPFPATPLPVSAAEEWFQKSLSLARAEMESCPPLAEAMTRSPSPRGCNLESFLDSPASHTHSPRPRGPTSPGVSRLSNMTTGHFAGSSIKKPQKSAFVERCLSWPNSAPDARADVLIPSPPAGKASPPTLSLLQQALQQPVLQEPSASFLNRSATWHSGAGPHVCSICGMRFPTVQALGGHGNGHRGSGARQAAGKRSRTPTNRATGGSTPDESARAGRRAVDKSRKGKAKRPAKFPGVGQLATSLDASPEDSYGIAVAVGDARAKEPVPVSPGLQEQKRSWADLGMGSPGSGLPSHFFRDAPHGDSWRGGHQPVRDSELETGPPCTGNGGQLLRQASLCSRESPPLPVPQPFRSMQQVDTLGSLPGSFQQLLHGTSAVPSDGWQMAGGSVIPMTRHDISGHAPLHFSLDEMEPSTPGCSATQILNPPPGSRDSTELTSLDLRLHL